MSPPRRHQVLWTGTALRMLGAIGDRRIQQQLFDASQRLETDPEKQGKPLREDLLGYRSLRAVGQRYRILYSVDVNADTVHVVAAGIRHEGARNDIYTLAQRLVRLGLATAPSRKPTAPTGTRKKK